MNSTPASEELTSVPEISSAVPPVLRLPRYAANKTFRLSERMRIVFRADTFNARNEVVLLAPNTTPTNSAFGRVTDQEASRSWQLSLTVRY